MHVSTTLDHVSDDHAYLADIVVAEFMNLQTCSAGNEDFGLMHAVKSWHWLERLLGRRH